VFQLAFNHTVFHYIAFNISPGTAVSSRPFQKQPAWQPS